MTILLAIAGFAVVGVVAGAVIFAALIGGVRHLDDNER